MDILSVMDDRTLAVWHQFIQEEALSDTQQEQFAHFMQMLLVANEDINLTAITTPLSVIRAHFQDSLFLDRCVDMNAVRVLCDVGTGAGFPGIPLKIKYPHLQVILIEVTHKRINFLHQVIAALHLEGIEIYELDWRTFLRKTEGEIDVFCARASLHPQELLKVFKPSSSYKDATLVYWASGQWQIDEKERPFLQKEVEYSVANKRRKLVFFAR